VADWVVESAARNHRGRLRADNEDNYYLNRKWMSPEAMAHGGRVLGESDGGFQLYAVCDGIGGEAAGEQASYETVEALGALQAAHPEGLSNLELLAAIAVLTDRIHGLVKAEEEHTGTTLTALLWQDSLVRVLNIGDSRIYRLRDGALTQLTADHSEVQRMVDLGLMTPFQARLSPQRHRIRQYVGLPSADETFEPYLSVPQRAHHGDWYLLCSDGLVDMVEDEAIRRILLRSSDPAEAVDALVQQALDNGGHDNVTALCLKIRDVREARRSIRVKGFWSLVRSKTR